MENLGVETSLLGFGCMRFPTDADGKIDRPAASALLELAIRNGVNYIDTAYPYHNGESEPVSGRGIGKIPARLLFFGDEAACVGAGDARRMSNAYSTNSLHGCKPTT